MDNLKLTLTVKEAAALLGVSLPTMYNLTRSAGFNAVFRIGRKVLINKSKLVAWINEQSGM